MTLSLFIVYHLICTNLVQSGRKVWMMMTVHSIIQKFNVHILSYFYIFKCMICVRVKYLDSILILNNVFAAARRYTRWSKEDTQAVREFFSRWIEGDGLPGETA
jgi:hypothetical protein